MSSDDRKPTKDVLIITKVIRCCQVMEVKTSELLTLMIDGNHEDGREDQWTLRMPSRQVFDEWNEILWNACAAAGLMEPYNCGLPPVDPRTNVSFAQVPLEYLYKFAVLEKALIHFFVPVTLLTPSLKKDSHSGQHILVVGDKPIYIFNQAALMMYCSLISHIRKIHHGEDATFFAVQIKSPAPDIVVKDFSEGVQLASILSRLFEVTTGKRLNIMPINVPTAELLVDSQQLSLIGDEGYKLKAVPPGTKMLLRQAIDAIREATGGVSDKSEKQQSQDMGEVTSALDNTDIDSSDPLTKLLHSIGLPQYRPTLLNQHVDLDILQRMDASDLMTFGVTNESHCHRILNAAMSSEMDALKITNDKPTASTVTTTTTTTTNTTTTTTTTTAPQKSGVAVTLSGDDDDPLVSKPPAKGAANPPIIIDDDDDL
ncbi:Sterile alpha motif domain [Trypanosoma melophagium]|uniref:Sterile alpha motif domain n=1 Tax=Trypanosoma melophagium TaxID=715481 RepID=UPI003519EE2A|nr:Sterile alpha motif domain [Trypanosoma melophagium]